jgi:hypothetical protein
MRRGGAASTRGQLDFTLPEALFDYDYPGHYGRKIKAVSVSIPCVVGPYQDLHATLTQNSDAIATAPDIAAVGYLATLTSATGKPPAPPPSVRQNWVANQQIALSQGVDDTGLFVLDFSDERYLPFEGTGAVSSWSFALPPETNPIDFDAITDVIVKIRYTARDGGAAFAQQVRQYYITHQDSQPRLFNATFSLARAFPGQWYQALHTAPVNGLQPLSFPVGDGIVLPNLRGVTLHQIMVQIELTNGSSVSSTAGKPFLSLQIAGAPPSGVPIAVANNFGAVVGGGLPSSFAGVDWTLTVDVNTAPSGLLTEDGTALDPAKLADIALVISYSAAPF